MTSSTAPHNTSGSITGPRRAAPRAQQVVSPRVSLHRQAPEAFRRHLLRGFARVLALVTTDLATFWLLREGVRAVRDYGVLGPGLAEWLGLAVPNGTLGGWEFVVALVIGLAFAGAYERGDAHHDAARILNGVALAAGLVLWHMMWTMGPEWFLIRFACTVGALWTALALERQAFDDLAARVLPRPRERVLFVGDGADKGFRRVYRQLVETEGMRPLGWASTDGAWGPEVLGSVDEIWHILQRNLPDTVVLCGTLSDQAFENVVEASTVAGCRVLAVSRYESVGHLRPGVVYHRGLRLVELTVPSLKARQLLIKRVIDIVGAVVGLVLLAPVFLVLAVAIALDSPGPVFFAQERVGLGGRVFRFIKFRTMRDGADSEKSSVAHLNHTGDPRLFKIPNDPRVTWLGAFLRRWSIDELPQLLNVLKGDMSLVGPRPFFEADLAAYDEHHFSRLGAKPGITGLWQVSGRSDLVDFEEVVRLDREYIDRWSLLLDLRILARTVPAVLRRRGAF